MGDIEDEHRIALRSELLDRARRGEMTGVEAENEAARLGCGPLASKPDDSLLNPMSVSHWSLTMAIAWIAWRTPDHVREWWDTYVEQCWDWRRERWTSGSGQPVYEGEFLEQRKVGTVIEMLLCEHLADETEPEAAALAPLAESRQQLWGALLRGAIQATAIDCHSEERVRIQPSEWLHLKPAVERDRDVLQDCDVFPARSWYEKVLLDAVAVRRIWSPRIDLPELPPPVRSPAEGGYIPLFCAAQWIATEGASSDVGWSPHDWRSAYGQLLARIDSGEVNVIGTHDGLPEPIDGLRFAGIRIVYPFESHSFLGVSGGAPMVLVSYPYVGESEWHSGVDDSIRNEDGPIWSKIMVRAEHIIAHWPFDVPSVLKNPLTHSGFSGRPSTKHLIQGEFKRRIQSGEAHMTLAVEAKWLLDWLLERHPNLSAPTTKTIQNNIRDQHRAYRAQSEGLK
ncbi:hypothetical protein L1787_18155 [Acuticoccus sp. M5D2P5]|uniref:hypothetical protein n=1 Tax=Acuticoccus kalidii TaxID=2910977 RepID=UPI001F2F0769|nr:hypothetical protein [Acuticoccus kalidii]MCF3935321.1 hypothetical protein [Acuticoccus kalidii]